jgi:PilZ domain-containing protein
VDQERRRTPRYPFAANAEVSEGKSGTPIKGRVGELSLNGCFMNTETPLAKGTPVEVKINTETDFFEAHGSVVYSQAGEGMGLMFLETKPYYISVLKKWLLAAMIGKGKHSS